MMSDKTIQIGGIMLIDGDQGQGGNKKSNNNNDKSSGTTNSSNKSSNAAPNKSSNPSKGSIIKDGWGSRSNFQASYGLDKEGEAILNAMQDADKGGRK